MVSLTAGRLMDGTLASEALHNGQFGEKMFSIIYGPLVCAKPITPTVKEPMEVANTVGHGL